MGKMTADEYRAKAMLLGMGYRETHHYFFYPFRYGSYDPDTLECLEDEEIQRENEILNKGMRS